MDKNCIFCKMVAGSIKTLPVYETKHVFAINDINPSAAVHVLIVPKKHIDSVLTISKEDSQELVEMYKAAQKIVEDKKLDSFRLAFNGGKLQHVPHLHMHLLAGGKIDWKKL